MRKTSFVLAVVVLLSACGVSFPKPDPNIACPAERIDLTKFPQAAPAPYVIAFTDEGAYVDRCKVSSLFHDLKGEPDRGQVVLLYVHGWKHNSTSPDLGKFTDQIEAIRKSEAKNAKRRVVGVYVAWNGKRTSWPIAREFTFWGRMQAADKVAQSAGVTRLLGAIESRRAKRGNKDDLNVYIGHSFGARILYNAVAQRLIYETELHHPGEPNKHYDVIHGVGDMVILLNPAFEASLFSVFNAVRRPEYPFNDEQQPLLVSISSDTDTATKVAFPFGQTLNFERLPERRTTVGNYKKFWTHRVTLRGGPPAEGDVCSKQVCMSLIAEDKLPLVPFINARADKAVINGHNGIWVPPVQEFIAHLISQQKAVQELKDSALLASPSASLPSPVAETNRD